MTAIEFLLNLLVFILGTTISLIITAVLGFLTIKRLISKAMESKEVKEIKEAIENLAKELERLKDRFDKLFNAKGANYIS